MASSTAMYTGLSGLLGNARRLDVIGNNIANVNTTAFKSSRLEFMSTFSRNFALGTSPGEGTGGTNPGQVGLGVAVAGTQRDFTNGAIGVTGVSTDLAIEGAGFFVVDQGGDTVFTRNGAFLRNEANELVTVGGGRVQGFDVDEQFQIVEGTLVDLSIPLGSMTLAQATDNVTFTGNLNASGDLPTAGSIHESRAFYTDAGLTGGNEIDGSEDMTNAATDLYISDGAGGSWLALDGGEQATITISGVEKGGQDLGTASFVFNATAVDGVDANGTTIDDFLAFLEDYLGLDSTSIEGQTVGGNVRISGGQIIVEGNEGTVQGLDISTADIEVTYPSTYGGTAISQPFVLTQTGTADGESVRTSFVVYDSLGTPVTVDLTFVLQENPSGAGSIWEFIAESSDNNDVGRVVGLGVVEFDADGAFSRASNTSFSIERGNGAAGPLSVSMSFDSSSDALSSLTDSVSSLAAIFQDGSPIGTLVDFAIGESGLITGVFSNGLTRDIGQVALANFANPEGLIDLGDGVWSVGPNSGDAVISAPLDLGAGRLVGGALELSNVDLSTEFINMILASTGYSAASRVITTSDELLDQLLTIGR